MKKFDIEQKEIKADDGTTATYNVLIKYADVNVVDAQTGRKYGVQRIAKQQIWFAPDEKEDIIDTLNQL